MSPRCEPHRVAARTAGAGAIGRWRWWLLLILAWRAAVDPGTVCGQPVLPEVNSVVQGARPFDRFGLDGWRLMLQQRLEPRTGDFVQWMREPKKTAIVITGDTRQLPRLINDLDRFLLGGGACLIATDRNATFRLSSFWKLGRTWHQFQFNRGWFEVPPEGSYQGHADVPIISVVRAEGGEQIAADLFAGVRTLIANRPGYLLVYEGGATRSAPLTIPCPAGAANFRSPIDSAAKFLFAETYGNREDAGRILLVADHSLFINEMLMHGDNMQFAWNCVNWLSAGQRANLIFVHDGRILPRCEIGSRGLPPIPLDKLLDALSHAPELPAVDPRLMGRSMLELANDSLVTAQEEDLFNQLLSDIGQSTQFSRNLAIVRLMSSLMLIALIAALRWLFFTRSRPPRKEGSPATPLVSERRIRAQVHAGRYDQYARGLAREFFGSDLAQIPVPDWALLTPPTLRPGGPQPATGDRLWSARAVRELWKLATDRRPRQVSSRGFAKVRQQYARLQSLRSEGKLQLQWDTQRTTQK